MKKEVGKIKHDQQTVVLEDINSKMTLVLEQFSGLNRKIDNNHKDFLGFRGEMIEFRGKMIEFRDEMYEFKDEMYDFRDKTDKNLKVALEYLFRIDEEIQGVKAEIEDLKTRPQKKDDSEKILKLEERIIKLEKLVFAKLV